MRRQRESVSAEVARMLRRGMTPEERLLWASLKSRQLGYSFRRQEPMGRYVADFVCFERHLVVELDGAHHLNSPQDVLRNAEMRARGLRVLRFWNHEVRNNL